MFCTTLFDNGLSFALKKMLDMLIHLVPLLVFVRHLKKKNHHTIFLLHILMLWFYINNYLNFFKHFKWWRFTLVINDEKLIFLESYYILCLINWLTQTKVPCEILSSLWVCPCHLCPLKSTFQNLINHLINVNLTKHDWINIRKKLKGKLRMDTVNIGYTKHRMMTNTTHKKTTQHRKLKR